MNETTNFSCPICGSFNIQAGIQYANHHKTHMVMFARCLKCSYGGQRIITK